MAKKPRIPTSDSHPDRDLLRRIDRAPGHRAGYKQLVREMGLGGGRERRLLLEQLARMTLRGDLVKIADEMWALPHAAPDRTARVRPQAQERPARDGSARVYASGDRLVAGKLDLHRDGFGFVRPDAAAAAAAREESRRGQPGSAAGATTKPDAGGDIFIPPYEIHGAMQGDLVLVDEAPRDREGRRSGRIVRVLTRRNPTVVGIFHYARPQRRREGEPFGPVVYGNYVTPLDERIGQAILIAQGDETPAIQGGDSPHRVLGEEAKRELASSIPRENAEAQGDESPSEEALGDTPADATGFILEGGEPSPEAAAFDDLAKSEPTVSSAEPGDDEGATRPFKRRRRGQIPFQEAEARPMPAPAASVREPAATLPYRAAAAPAPDAAPVSPEPPDDRYTVHQPLEGLAVDVEITHFPSPGSPARGRVIEILGPPDGFGVDVEIIIRKHHLPHTFPANVLAEAAESAQETVATLTPEELEARMDFRGLPIVTIDGETARDFDDAVLVTPLDNGNFELQVHIADVSHYVRPGTSLDVEARLRGTSVYFPDRAVPMLPPELSSGICSLRPDEDRLVMSCIAEIDPDGEVVGYRVAEGIIRSARRMTYTAVQQCLNAAPPGSIEGWWHGLTPEPTIEDREVRAALEREQPGLPERFDAMLALALKLNAKRRRRGSIDFDLPEPVVQFDPDGSMKAIVRSERGWSNRLIEEFMLTANECVSTWLEGNGIESVYRIHEMPDPKRILEFEETASAFGHSLGLGSLPVKRMTMKADRRQSRNDNARRGGGGRAPQQHEVAESIPVTPQMYQRLVKRISGKPEERILAYLMLRSLKQARYSEKNEGHFALASPSYTHFTSPIRRYPDLIVHRLMRAMLQRGASPIGGPIRSNDTQPWQQAYNREHAPHKLAKEARVPHSSQSHRDEWDVNRPPSLNTLDPIPREELAAVTLESSQAERRAADAERELIEWKKLKFMEPRVGEEFDGIVLSCTKYGFFVELEELFIEGLVPIGTLGGWGETQRYVFRDTDRAICSVSTGHCYRIGQPVRVILDRIDRQQRRLQFAVVPEGLPLASQRGPKAKRAKKTKAEPHTLAAHVEPLSPHRTGKKSAGKTKSRATKNKGKRRS